MVYYIIATPPQKNKSASETITSINQHSITQGNKKLG